jgi:hypothetical protein
VTLLREEKGKEHGKKLCLFLCTGEWLKGCMDFNVSFYYVLYLKCDKGKDNSY